MASLKREGDDLSQVEKPSKKRKAIATELPMDKLTKLLNEEDTVAAGMVAFYCSKNHICVCRFSLSMEGIRRSQ